MEQSGLKLATIREASATGSKLILICHSGGPGLKYFLCCYNKILEVGYIIKEKSLLTYLESGITRCGECTGKGLMLCSDSVDSITRCCERGQWARGAEDEATEATLLHDSLFISYFIRSEKTDSVPRN